MTTSFTATNLGVNKAIARSVPMSTAGLTSLDVLTLNHGLGATPDTCLATPVSVVGTPSGGALALILQARGATTVTWALMAGTGVGNTVGNFDIIVERTHSMTR